MAITYNAGTNVITVTAYTEGTPCNFTDIYNADVAGSWGVVTRQCTHQFCFTAALKIGDGSTVTWFADEAKQVIFTGADVPKAGEGVDFDWKVLLKANSNFRLGKVEDATDKTTSNGCQIIFNLTGHAGFGTCLNSPPSTAKIELYSTSMVSIPAYFIFLFGQDGGKMYNCILTDYVNPIRWKNTNIYNVNVENGLYGLSELAGAIDKVFVTHCGDASTMGGVAIADSIIKNSIFVNNTKLLYMSSPAYDVYMVNCTADAWTIRNAAVHSSKLYRQYELDLKVIDKDNVAINAATVKVWDKDSNLIVDTTTNASGVIATQTITRGYYDFTNGDTLQEASPHLIKITKAGYTMYEADFTLGDKIDWLIALQTSILRNPSMGGGMV